MKGSKTMTRIIEAEMTTRASNVEKAIRKFFQKHPEIDYWRETFDYMAEHGHDFFSDTLLADGTKNHDWTYALHLDVNERISSTGVDVYLCVIERA